MGTDWRTLAKSDAATRIRALILTAANAHGNAALEAEEEILGLGERAIPFLLEARIEIATHITASELLFRIAETDPMMLVRSDALADAVIDNNDERAWIAGKKLLPRCSVATRLLLTTRKKDDAKLRSSLKWLAENNPDGFIEGALSAIREPRSGSEIWAPVLDIAGKVGRPYPEKFLPLIQEIVETKEHSGTTAETAIAEIGMSRTFAFFTGMDEVNEERFEDAISGQLKRGKLENLEKALSVKAIAGFAEKYVIEAGLSDEGSAVGAAKLFKAAGRETAKEIIRRYDVLIRKDSLWQHEAAKCAAIMLESTGKGAASELVSQIGSAKKQRLEALAELAAVLCKQKPRMFTKKQVAALAKAFTNDEMLLDYLVMVKHICALGPRALPQIAEKYGPLVPLGETASDESCALLICVERIVAADPKAPEVKALVDEVVAHMCGRYDHWREMDRALTQRGYVNILPAIMEYTERKGLHASHLLRLSEFIQGQPESEKAHDALWFLLKRLEDRAGPKGFSPETGFHFPNAVKLVVEHHPAEADAIAARIFELMKKKDKPVWVLAALAFPHAGAKAKEELFGMPMPTDVAYRRRYIFALACAWEESGAKPDPKYLREYMRFALDDMPNMCSVGIKAIARVGHSAIGDVTGQFWKISAKKHHGVAEVSEMNQCINVLGEMAAMHEGNPRNMEMVPFLLRTLGMPGHQNDAEKAIMAVGRQAVLPLLDEATRHPELAERVEKIIAMIDAGTGKVENGVVKTPERPADMQRIFSNFALDVSKPAGNLVRVK